MIQLENDEGFNLIDVPAWFKPLICENLVDE